MKKIFLILFILGSLLIITSCKQNDESNNTININYKETDLQQISLTLNNYDITLDESNNNNLKNLLLSIKLFKNNNNQNNQKERISKYVITFNGYEITIYDDNTICYIDNQTEYDYLYTLNNEFNYLDTLYEDKLISINNYSSSQLIKVFNSSNESVEIKEKNVFLYNLEEVKCLQLYNVGDYQLGDLKYQILIDEEIINIYNDYIMINDNLYVIVSGGFNFLNNIDFNSSSGWLPWL